MRIIDADKLRPDEVYACGMGREVGAGTDRCRERRGGRGVEVGRPWHVPERDCGLHHIEQAEYEGRRVPAEHGCGRRGWCF